MNVRFVLLWSTALLSLGTFDAGADSIVTDWNNAALAAVRATKFGPPMTARAFAIVHTCTYDAWAAYDSKANGTQYLGNLRRPLTERTERNKETAISYAAYRALVDLFPSQKAAFDTKMAELGLDPADVSTDIKTAVGIGNVVAATIISDRHHDGANQLGDLNPGAYSDYTGFVPINSATVLNNPSKWQTVPFSDGAGGFRTPAYLTPHWGFVKPFALAYASQFRPVPPFKLSTDPERFIKQAQYIVDLTARLNDKRKAIAEYWADGPASETPPGHWQLFAQFVSLRDSYSIDEDARLFFALGNAMLDASIATWEAKLAYESARPINAIRFLFEGKTLRTWGATDEPRTVVGPPDVFPPTVAGELWKPYQPDTFLTPPFPEHTSGHSCFSSAAAYILRSFTGSDGFGLSATIAAGSSHIQAGVPSKEVTLSWDTFTEAANEAGLSRRYGGIHFPRGDLAGRKLGLDVGTAVWTKCQKLFEGKTRKTGG